MKKINTDKFKNGIISEYEKLFSVDFRNNRVKKYLEIGIYEGGSLLWAKDFFPNADILGIDIKPPLLNIERINTFQADQNDTERLLEIGKVNGLFDVIIDDGSHFTEETCKTFYSLWQYVSNGGWYIIEDWLVGYRSYYKKHFRCQGILEIIQEIMVRKEDLDITSMRIIYNKNNCSIACFQKNAQSS